MVIRNIWECIIYIFGVYCPVKNTFYIIHLGNQHHRQLWWVVHLGRTNQPYIQTCVHICRQMTSELRIFLSVCFLNSTHFDHSCFCHCDDFFLCYQWLLSLTGRVLFAKVVASCGIYEIIITIYDINIFRNDLHDFPLDYSQVCKCLILWAISSVYS